MWSAAFSPVQFIDWREPISLLVFSTQLCYLYPQNLHKCPPIQKQTHRPKHANSEKKNFSTSFMLHCYSMEIKSFCFQTDLHLGANLNCLRWFKLRIKSVIRRWNSLYVFKCCTENWIYVFPEKELCGLSPSSYIHVSVSDLNIPRISPHCCSKIDRLILKIYKSLTDIWV